MAEQRRLLIAEDARDRYLGAQMLPGEMSERAADCLTSGRRASVRPKMRKSSSSKRSFEMSNSMVREALPGSVT